MTRFLSMDIQDRAMARLNLGETVRDVAEALSVAPSSAVKWSQRRRAFGSVAPAKVGGNLPLKFRGGAGGLAVRPDGIGVHAARSGGRTGGARTWPGLESGRPHDVEIRAFRRSQLQKSPLWPGNRSGPTWPASASAGRRIKSGLT